MTAPVPPQLFDPQRRLIRLERSRASFAQSDFLHKRVAEGMADSLLAIPRRFDQVADLSPHAGVFEAVVRGGGAADRIGHVQTIGTLAERAAPGQAALGLEPGSQDLIVSILGLHWANDLPGALTQIRRALKPDGLFLGALFGAGTLAELRQALTEAELAVRGGAQARVSPFADAYDAAGLLQRAGFALPVADGDTVTVRYGSVPALVRDLRGMGETSSLAGPIRPLTPAIMGALAETYQDRFAEADGRLPVRFEIIHLAGWAPHESQQKPLPRGSATHSLAAALSPRSRKD